MFLVSAAIGIIAGAALVPFVLRWLLVRHVDKPWAQGLIQRCTLPCALVAATVAAKISLAGFPGTGPRGERSTLGAQLLGGHEAWVQHGLLLVLIGAVAWLTAAAVPVATGALLHEIEANHGPDSTRARRTQTQIMLVQRVVTAAAVVVAIGAMLFTWQEVRAVGAGLLASAGVAGIIIGIAAQPAIGNLFAGFQLAFGDMLHMDDVVVVEGKWGQVEELTLSYVVIRIWDGKRLVLPVSYFTQTPFENWTKRDSTVIGTVYLRVDWSVRVDGLREALHEMLRENPLWDGAEWGLVVTDVLTNGMIELRATMSATDGFASWTLNCEVRERLVAHVREHHPESLPRMRAEITGADS